MRRKSSEYYEPTLRGEIERWLTDSAGQPSPELIRLAEQEASIHVLLRAVWELTTDGDGLLYSHNHAADEADCLTCPACWADRITEIFEVAVPPKS